MSIFQGVLPAVVTPFDDNGGFVPAAMDALLGRLYAKGSHGIYVLGQTGEGLTTPTAIRKQAAEFAVKASPAGKTVIVHIGSSKTAEAVELARHASKIGAHAISSLPPAGGLSFAEIRAYYEALASVSDVPLLVYFFPEVSAAISTADQIFDLCSIPNVAGLKFTDFDLFKLSRISIAGHTIFNGRDEVFAAGMLMGACGGIGTFYNVIPELFVEVYNLAAQNRWEEARKVQDRINVLIALTIRYPVFPAVKKMLQWSGVDCGDCLAPRRSLTAGEQAQLRAELEAASFDPAGFLK